MSMVLLRRRPAQDGQGVRGGDGVVRQHRASQGACGGQSNEEAALREIYEETGIRARIMPGFEGELVYPQGRGMLKHFYYFLASFDADQQFIAGDVVDAELLPYDQAMRKLSFMDVRQLLRRAEVFLNSGAFAKEP